MEEQSRSKKVIVFFMRRRKGYRRSYGQVNEFTRLKIDKIEYDLSREALARAVAL